MRKRWFAILALAAVLAGCGDDGDAGDASGPDGTTGTSGTSGGTSGGSVVEGSGSEFDSAEALAEEIGCSGYQPGDPAWSGTDPAPTALAQCQLDGQQLNITLYASADDRRTAVTQLPDVGCGLAAALGIRQVELVVGPNWTVVPVAADGATLADQVAETLGAQRHTVDCS